MVFHSGDGEDEGCSSLFWRDVVEVEGCWFCCALVDQLQLELLRRLDVRMVYLGVGGGQSTKCEGE